MEEENPLENKEVLDELLEQDAGWVRYLSISTAIIAVCAALATLLSSNYSNSALLSKNEAILAQSKASDQWNYYQAKGIKKNIYEAFNLQKPDPTLKSEIDRYATEQKDIQKQAQDFEVQVAELNHHSEQALEKHHQAAVGVTLFQISIALSAMAALLRKRRFWLLSLSGSLIGLVFLVLAIIR